MATIKKIEHKDGSVSYKVTVFVYAASEDGKKVQRRKYLTIHPEATAPKKREKEVRDKAAEFERLVKEGLDYSDGDRTTLDDVIRAWDRNVLQVKIQSGDIGERCRDDYQSLINNHMPDALRYMPISKIKAANIDSIIKEMLTAGKSNKTIRNCFQCYHQIFDYAVRSELIPSNPCDRISHLPNIKREKKLHTFSTDQATRFLEDALDIDIPRKNKWNRLEDKAFFTLALYAGFRKGEILALTWNDIDFESRKIKINKAVGYCSKEKEYIKDPKTESGYRCIELPKACFTLLAEWKQTCLELCMKAGNKWQGYRGSDFDRNAVFIRSNGKRLPNGEPLKHFHLIVDAYNKEVPDDMKLPEIRLHDLRHTCASHLYAQGTDIETVANRLGHKEPSFTLDIYAHALEEKDAEASDTLEKLFSR